MKRMKRAKPFKEEERLAEPVAVSGRGDGPSGWLGRLRAVRGNVL